ncbi:hypothetical protein OMCYN_01881 [cyanobiont of Ornithocercus magnificus]|nr:hypothetical protein OMCYN_01881 [cyanobiont of Ornithocercus magnificus]
MYCTSLIALSLLSASVFSPLIPLVQALPSYQEVNEQQLYDNSLVGERPSNSFRQYMKNPMQLMRHLHNVNAMKDATEPAHAISDAIEKLEDQFHQSVLKKDQL